MPGRDGTGPMGVGKMSGRGLGACSDAKTGSDVNVAGAGFGRGCRCGFGRGQARGNGRGFGRGNGYNRTPSASQKEVLEEQQALLQNRLEMIQKQLDNL